MVVRLAVAVGVAVRLLGTSARQGSTCTSCQGCVEQSQEAVPWCTVGFDSWECAPAGVTADAATCWCVDEEGTEIFGTRRPGVGDLSCIATKTMAPPATEQLIRAGHICPAFNNAYYNASLINETTYDEKMAIAEECDGHEACTWIPSEGKWVNGKTLRRVCIACIPGAYYRGCFFFGTGDFFSLIPITMMLCFLMCACTGPPGMAMLNTPGKERIILADVFCECCSPEADESVMGILALPCVVMFGFYGMLAVEAYERYPECRCRTPEVLPGLVWTLEWMLWPTGYIVLLVFLQTALASGCRCDKWRISGSSRFVPIYTQILVNGKEKKKPGLVYSTMVCTQTAVVQNAIELDSAQVGVLHCGDTIKVTTARAVKHEGHRIVRVRFSQESSSDAVTAIQGWTSLRSQQGDVMLAPSGALEQNPATGLVLPVPPARSQAHDLGPEGYVNQVRGTILMLNLQNVSCSSFTCAFDYVRARASVEH
jgi:hypothetical protein